MRTTISIDNDLFAQLQGYSKLRKESTKSKRKGSLSSVISSCIAMGLPFLMERLPKAPSESLADCYERRMCGLSTRSGKETSAIEAIAIRKEAFQLEDDIRSAFLSRVISSQAYFDLCSRLMKVVSKGIVV